MKKFKVFLLTHFSLVFLTFGICNATTIIYSVTDLDDTTVGEDLWGYSYTVSGDPFITDYGFTIFFDLALHGIFDPLPSAPNPSWNVISFNPDPSIPDDGIYDALALADNASLADDFAVSFVWLGPGNPGSQAFEVYNSSSFDPIESGNTSPVPEPATMVLFGVGVVCFISLRKKFKTD